ncbi:hypothetical protein Msil_0456 [Methylocella silvestris BL2]|uniref:Uncharacterized protein n=1 Tax=Methylocella silvestris (strain DSM 15510 / CIP 108128 / LMG 27833 / NCIMB 13906 / BL2) TaxID=395965 RepID=B8EJM6_METSB|nr:hypothetical protein [Methylocella silvestris]ACK49430.1 hypothetical protein Msil_0456 [Methylocella silvestris BL2]
MNRMLKQESFSVETMAPFSGRFERPVATKAAASALCAQFGSRLRKVFDVPCVESTEDKFAALLEQINAKLG